MTENHLQRQMLNKLTEALDLLKQKKELSQAEIAGIAGIRPQYLSDIKKEKRKLSLKLYTQIGDALGKKLGCEWQEKLGAPKLGSTPLPSPAAAASLPVLSKPFHGLPNESSVWDGCTVELSGAAAVLSKQAKTPYVLRVPDPCHDERLKPGDLVLVDQSPTVLDPRYTLVQTQSGVELVRNDGMKRIGLDKGEVIEGKATVTGRVIAILFGRL